MDISCGHFYSQYKSVLATGCVGLIGKLPLMVSFHEHPTVRVRGGYRLFYRPTSTWAAAVIVLFYGRFPKFFPLRVHFLPQLLGVHLRRSGYLFLLILLLAG